MPVLLLLVLLPPCGFELSAELRCPLPQGHELLKLDALRRCCSGVIPRIEQLHLEHVR